FNPLSDTLVDGDGRTFKLDAPAPAPDVPPGDFVRGGAPYVAPPRNGKNVDLQIDPASERLQRLHPWPAWNGEDFRALPILVKTRGKTTTDHISPAGPWLRYRGHLDKFSDNMFSGAVNAFTGETGKGRNSLTGESAQTFSDIARSCKA